MTEQPPEAAPSKASPSLNASTNSNPTLVMAKIWNVSTNPPSNSIKGNIMPSFLSLARRRLSVEIYRINNAGGGYFEECFIRVMVPTTKEQKLEFKRQGRQARRGKGDASVSGMTTDFDDSASLLDGGSNLADYDLNKVMLSYDGWEAKYKLPLNAITILGVEKKVISCSLSFRAVKQTRRIYFHSEQEAIDCANFIDSQQQLNERRRHQKFVQNSSGIKVDPTENISFLIELVGATDIPVGDLTASDPYVVCYFDHVRVHQTKHVPKTLDPIWTIKTKGLFLLECTAAELFQGDGLHLDLMDFDMMGDHERLGYALVDPRSMYDGNGKRLKLNLKGKNASGTLSVRIRHASAFDKNFMKEFQLAADAKKTYSAFDDAIKKALAKKGGKNAIQSALNRNIKTEKHAIGPPVKKYRVRPGPDPKREEETAWMTMERMEQEMVGESRQWVDAGSGSLGRLFVEVLACQGLPNLDTGGFAGNLTDAFACLVFEDVWGQTDIIDDDLNPKWMPWAKRAFIFHVDHPSSQLYVGIFDYDSLGDHDLIGRVAVNLSNLQPDTVYTLTYDLYHSGKWNVREPKGKVTLRLRMEFDDERKLVLASLQPPKTIYVNVMKRKEFKLLDAVCNGGYDMEAYSWKTLSMYLEELQSYQECAMFAKGALITLLFWRGHHSLVVGGKTYLLPVHSMVAFVGITFVVEYPQLIPSFFFFCISWLLFATMMLRRDHPNAWRDCKTFFDIFVAVVWGDSFPPARIKSCQNIDEIRAYEEEWQKKVERELKAAEEARKIAEEEAAELERMAELVGDTNVDITTKTKTISFPGFVDILKPYLEPLQAYLVVGCRLLRYVRNIITWEECYFSFWVTLSSFILSILSLTVPWFFVMKWTSRIVVWTVFGPWMKAVDVFYWTPMENMTEEDREKLKEKAKLLKEKYLAESVEKARINRERAVKLKAMKQFLFGKFIMKVPILKEDRWTDVPLPESSAVPYTPKGLGLAEVAMKEAGYKRLRVPGQHLEGDMIPNVQTSSFTEAPIGQATKKHAQPETDSAAYIKVGSLVAGAAVITYYGIPLGSFVMSRVFGA